MPCQLNRLSYGWVNTAISKRFKDYKDCSLAFSHLILATMLSNTAIQSKTPILHVRGDGFFQGQASGEGWEAESRVSRNPVRDSLFLPIKSCPLD